MLDSELTPNFQGSYSLFPVSPPQEEKSDLKKSMHILENIIQTQNYVTQSIVRLEVQMSELVNAYRNGKTFSYQLLTNPDISNPINMTQESCYFENQDLVSSHPFEIDQN